MKRISSQATFLYQIVWPFFCIVFLPVIIKMMFKMPILIVFGFIYIVVCVWVLSIYMRLKDLWIDNENLIITNLSGKKITINRKDITEVTQNPTFITPRLVKIHLKSDFPGSKLIIFIPIGGAWKYWPHEIVEELNKWRAKE